MKNKGRLHPLAIAAVLLACIIGGAVIYTHLRPDLQIKKALEAYRDGRPGDAVYLLEQNMSEKLAAGIDKKAKDAEARGEYDIALLLYQVDIANDATVVSNTKLFKAHPETAWKGAQVYLGSWDIDANLQNGGEPILWTVVDGGKHDLWLLCDWALESIAFCGEDGNQRVEENVPWEASDLKQWIDAEFAPKAFSYVGNLSVDEVRIPTCEEMERYISGGYASWACFPTVYAMKRTGNGVSFDQLFGALDPESDGHDAIIDSYSYSDSAILAFSHAACSWWLMGDLDGERAPWMHMRSTEPNGFDGRLWEPDPQARLYAARRTGFRPLIHVAFSETWDSPDFQFVSTGRPAVPAFEKGAPYTVGDTVKLGAYEQDGMAGNGKEPLAWSVTAVEDGRALLVCDSLIDSLPYGRRDDQSVGWGESWLRAWLNNEFFHEAFSEEEQECILKTRIRNATYENTEITEDRVFLLSAREVKEFWPEEEERRMLPSAAAKCRENRRKASTTMRWWLRRTADVQDPLWVCEDGKLRNAFQESDEYKKDAMYSNPLQAGVRPAVWVDLDDMDR